MSQEVDPEREDAISFDRLEKDPNAPLAVVLMVAANDLFFDFNGIQSYIAGLPDDKYKSYLRQASALHLSRLICSRMLECLDLMLQIKGNTYFMSVLAEHPDALVAFGRLLEYRKGGEFSEVHQRLERIRNNGSFHYESLEKLFRQLFKGSYKPYRGNHGTSVMFPDQSPFFERHFLADTLLSAVFISKILPSPGGRPQSDEDLKRDFATIPETIRDFGIDFYHVVHTILRRFIYDLQQPEPLT